MSKILIIEDEVAIADLEKDYLELSGFDVAIENAGDTGLERALSEKFDLVVLDLMLPGMSGEDLLVKIKQEHPEVAVIISSAKEDTKTRIELLRAGADDYIVKPYDVDELLARLEAVLRRSSRGPQGVQRDGDNTESDVLQYKDICMERNGFRVTVSNTDIKLTKREYMILELLMTNPGKVFTKNNLYESVWNEEFLGEDNAVNVHISNLRQKLAKVNPSETYIETVWGIGFKMK